MATLGQDGSHKRKALQHILDRDSAYVAHSSTPVYQTK